MTAAAFSSDNKLLLVAYSFQGRVGWGLDPNRFDLWDVDKGARLSAPGSWIAGDTGYAQDVSFVPSASLALSAGPGGVLGLWDVRRQTLVGTLGGGAEGPACVAVAVDGKLALSAYRGGHLKVWDLRRRQLVRELSIAPGVPKQIVISPDAKLVLIVFVPTIGESQAIELRRVDDGTLVRRVPHFRGMV